MAGILVRVFRAVYFLVFVFCVWLNDCGIVVRVYSDCIVRELCCVLWRLPECRAFKHPNVGFNVTRDGSS